MNDWVVMPCGCQSNRRTNRVVISKKCMVDIHRIWANVIRDVNEDE